MKIIYLLLSALVLSCASAKKTAIKLTEKGDCEGALDHWAKAYKEDPKDDEVQDGFRHCQEKVSNDRLVKIRNLRTSKEEERALLELKSLVELQMRHGMRLDYNSSTFQGKESLWLWGYNRSQLKNLLRDDKPLAADYRQRKFALVFSSHPDYATAYNEIKAAGALHCKKIRKGLATRPFYRSFTDQYCRYFSPGRVPSATVKTQVSDLLYGKIHPRVDVRGTDDNMTAGLLKSLQDGFDQSPWFHPESTRGIGMNVTGNFDVDLDQNWMLQTHEYEEKVPYTEYKTVTKERQAPYTNWEEVCTMTTGARVCRREAVTRYRTETYTEQEPVTKYRKVTRYHQYRALKKDQKLTLKLKGTVSIDKDNHPFVFQKTESESQILHDEDLPSIGLYPARTDVTPPEAKFSEYQLLARVALTEDLNTIWVKIFCHLPPERDLASLGENVLRCRRSPKHPVEFVDTWFINNFGVTAGDAEMIVGKF